MNFEYKREIISGISVFHLKGQLIDKNQSTDFSEELDLMIANGESNFIIDLADLIYVNSSGLNVIINALTKSRKAGGDVIVTNVTTKVKELLVITKLSTIFKLTETIDEAIKLFSHS